MDERLNCVYVYDVLPSFSFYRNFLASTHIYMPKTVYDVLREPILHVLDFHEPIQQSGKKNAMLLPHLDQYASMYSHHKTFNLAILVAIYWSLSVLIYVNSAGNSKMTRSY